MNERPRGLIVAIDGPAASGKSTTAAAVAAELGYCHLNSGQLYRAITWAALDRGWLDSEPGTFERELDDLALELVAEPPEFALMIDGRTAGDGLRSRETAARVSEVASLGAVRARVLRILRAEGEKGGLVCDGRDIGTVVFPAAELKVFLVASPEERGRRRLLDHGVEPTPARVRDEAALLEERDAADSTRQLSPLRKASDAVEVDTTGDDFEQVVDRVVDLARRAGAGPPHES